MLVIVVILIAALPAWAVETQTGGGLQVQLFADLNDDSASVYINYLAGKSIIKGFDDGTFRPGEGLTRAQAAVLMTRAAGIAPDSTADLPFTDVAADYWAGPSIATSVKAGYIKGFPDNSFHPEEKLTRAQAAAMVLRLSRQSLNKAANAQFNDLNSEHWAAAAAVTAVASGMMLAGSDGRQFQPDQEMTRAEIARALAVLLTSDPELYKTRLTGTIIVKKGTVSIEKDQQKPVIITCPAVIDIGDTIITAGNSMAEINFEDGSGLLLKENARLTVTDAYGRSYIRHDGTAGVAVEWLNINMAGGELFGAVPTTMSNSEENQADSRKELQTTGFLDQYKTPLLASLNSPGLIAAAAEDNKTAPWYNTSKTKRVKVKIDMPWGVAAVRGTQFFVGQNSGGTDISVLEGTVTATGNSPRGTNTYDIGAGQFARIGSSGSFTSPPAPMNQNQLRRWVNEQQWVRERAEQIMQNQETDMNSSSNQSSSTQQPVTGTLDDINQALQEAQDSIRQNTSGGSSGGSFRYITSLQLPEDTQLTVAYRQAYELPAVVTAYYSDDTNSTVSVTWNPNTVDTSVVGTQTFTGTVSGYSGTVTLNLTVIMEELGEILGSYELEDGLILDNYIYDNGVLTQDLSINPSDALLARANYYEILSSYSSNPIISMQPLDQSVRVMKKLFDNLERLRIVFYDESENIVAYAGFNSSGVLTNLVNRTISGRISLPEGMNAPAGGMDIILYAYDQVFNYTVPLTIREGEHEADYSIAVAYNYSFMPYGLSTMAESEVSVNGYNLNDRNIRNPEMRPMFSDSNTQGYQLHYQIIGSYGADLVMSGQYNETIDVSDSSQSEINLQLEKGQLILGTIKLPEDLTADSDLDIYVEAVDHSGEYYKYYYDSVLIQSGQNEVPFSLTVPGQISYLLQYYIYDQASHAEQVNGHLLREGYYSLSGASFNEEEATQIGVEDAAVNDIDFVMASGKQIYGTISLANGQLAPQDISVYVEAYIQATDDYISEQYVLSQDSQSVDFALVVPASQVSLYIYFNDE